MTRKSKTLKNYRECRVSNCSNRIWNGGYVCTAHRYRFKKYQSYDLPSYVGEPSTLNIIEAPAWSFGECKVHGFLKEDEMYKSHTQGKYKTKGCKRCVIDRNIKNKYSLSGIEEFKELCIKQDYKCLICCESNKLCIDHCHVSGKFRGIICMQCNSGLGYFKDSIKYLQTAIDYLKKHE
jgi:hypothetical protein